ILAMLREMNWVIEGGGAAWPEARHAARSHEEARDRARQRKLRRRGDANPPLSIAEIRLQSRVTADRSAERYLTPHNARYGDNRNVARALLRLDQPPCAGPFAAMLRITQSPAIEITTIILEASFSNRGSTSSARPSRTPARGVVRLNLQELRFVDHA